MKALIVDIEGKYAVAMTKKGTFIKVKNTGKYTVGYEADLPSGILTNVKLMAGAASAAVFLLAAGLGIFFYTNPYSYINIDINPSVQITANIFDRIIKVTALNDDAQKIVEDLSIKNKVLDQGVEQVVNSAVKNGYLKDEKTNAIMLTVTSANSSKNKKLQEKVAVVVEKKIKLDKINSEVLVEEVNDKNRTEAVKQGISPGKLKLVQKLIGLDPSLKAEDLIDKPVKEILKAIRDYSKSQKTGKSDNSNNIPNGKNNNNYNTNNNSNNNNYNNSNNNKKNDKNDKNNKNSKNNNNNNVNNNYRTDFKKDSDKEKKVPEHGSTPVGNIRPSKDKKEGKNKENSVTVNDRRMEFREDSKDNAGKIQSDNDKNQNNIKKNSDIQDKVSTPPPSDNKGASNQTKNLDEKKNTNSIVDKHKETVEEPKKTDIKKKVDNKKSNNTNN
ncbi:anti-sigma factor domain-containing protein [Pseudobacteroides cellulosolvens]|uniref:Anti-sigma factor RsgI, N-terminal n=1 Tax=Pseudobacteroides cellulosolvens ATCC 35603 = DSM 2933 TaxID=398512 RepID=A0A0L6JP52_9FIRM|nr:anti-sigma factor domain-containing protein [Pseudobacteroides cellulosolvens]KNY27485.1 Anti-sigma factor RsgI, N-terminal [Pseudobacteroides cellulosolvens ATCC 35603 = DSM 2933]